MTQAEFIGLIEAELDQPVKRIVGNALVMHLLGFFNKDMAETVEMMYLWNDAYVVETTKAEKGFGLKATPMKDAIRETLAWCREALKK